MGQFLYPCPWVIGLLILSTGILHLPPFHFVQVFLDPNFCHPRYLMSHYFFLSPIVSLRYDKLLIQVDR